MLSLHLLQQNFFTVKWFGISLGFTVYIIREHYIDCLEKGNSNSNVILTPSAAKCFIVKRFGISLEFTVYTIRRTVQDCLEKYISLLTVMFLFTAFTCGIFFNTQRQILYLGVAM